ncbi:unnamed protein product, partial [Ectocarpus sp. 4 AP-2014]
RCCSKGHRVLITGRNFAHPVAADVPASAVLGSEGGARGGGGGGGDDGDASREGGLCNGGVEERVIATSGGGGGDALSGEAPGRRELKQAEGKGDHLADDVGGGGGGEMRRS